MTTADNWTDYHGTISQYRITGTSLIEGFPDYDLTLEDPDLDSLSIRVESLIGSASFRGAVGGVVLEYRAVEVGLWGGELNGDAWLAAREERRLEANA